MEGESGLVVGVARLRQHRAKKGERKTDQASYFETSFLVSISFGSNLVFTILAQLTAGK